MPVCDGRGRILKSMEIVDGEMTGLVLLQSIGLFQIFCEAGRRRRWDMGKDEKDEKDEEVGWLFHAFVRYFPCWHGSL